MRYSQFWKLLEFKIIQSFSDLLTHLRKNIDIYDRKNSIVIRDSRSNTPSVPSSRYTVVV